MGILELEGMEFYACHGCLEHEKRNPNLFTVDFRAELDMEEASRSDALEDAIDYGLIYDIAASVMNGKHSDLIEHLAGEIIRKIEAEFPQIPLFSIRVSKHRPPVKGVAAWSRVTLEGGSRKQGE